MKKLLGLKSSTRLVVCLTVLLCVGCDYFPRTIYEIKTIDGKTLKLACPTVDIQRSRMSYIIEGQCIAIN